MKQFITLLVLGVLLGTAAYAAERRDFYDRDGRRIGSQDGNRYYDREGRFEYSKDRSSHDIKWYDRDGRKAWEEEREDDD